MRRVLVAMGLSPEVPVLCPARGPPEVALGFSGEGSAQERQAHEKGR